MTSGQRRVDGQYFTGIFLFTAMRNYENHASSRSEYVLIYINTYSFKADYEAISYKLIKIKIFLMKLPWQLPRNWCICSVFFCFIYGAPTQYMLHSVIQRYKKIYIKKMKIRRRIRVVWNKCKFIYELLFPFSCSFVPSECRSWHVDNEATGSKNRNSSSPILLFYIRVLHVDNCRTESTRAVLWLPSARQERFLVHTTLL